MALYSVWDWDRNAWAIYRDGRTVSVGDDPKPPRPTSRSVLGADPDTQTKPLPWDAKFVGYDHMCRGEVRHNTSSLSLSGLGIEMPSGSDIQKYLFGGAIGWLVATFWKRRRS